MFLKHFRQTIHAGLHLLGLTAVLVSVGCDAKIERFDSNQVFAVSLERRLDSSTERAAHDVDLVVTKLFGSPEEPRWPVDLISTAGLQVIADPETLSMAVGKVSSDQKDVHSGLYTEHCVRCHGISGSGTGAVSLFQNPYPRDFRPGVFKWKSTQRNAKPTRDDLLRVIRQGIRGTSMPSFSLIAEDVQEALVDYTIYLAVRGQVERLLLTEAVADLGYSEEDIDEELSLAVAVADEFIAETEAGDLIRDTVRDVVNQWIDEDNPIVSVPEPPASTASRMEGQLIFEDEAIERGRLLFEGQVANCISCHGKNGNGDAVTLDYDDWTKEYTTRIGLTPTDREAIKPLRQAGALRPRAIKPRRLADSIFRGNESPESVYRLITQGIAGTPMPALLVSDTPSPTGVTEDQIWDLVAYVNSLSPSPVEGAAK